MATAHATKTVVLMILLSGCASIERSVERGADYHHVVMKRIGSESADPIHVYIEGDGTPYTSRSSVAADPTPKRPLAYGLMLRDPQGGIYIGRPCYYGLADLPECHPRLWTTARYGESVLESMAAVVRANAGNAPVVLIGHSGGGALAMLLAARLDNVAGLITIAANLDVTGWVAAHGYSPLYGSLDPLDVLAQIDDLPQRHFVGGRDVNVPPELTLSLVDRLPKNSLCLVPSYGHDCCWRDSWQSTIKHALNHLSRASMPSICQ